MDRELQKLKDNLAANVTRLRNAKKLTQETLALEGGVDRSYLSSIENGKSNPSVLLIHKLAQRLDSTVIKLLSESEQAGEGPDDLTTIPSAVQTGSP